MEYLVRHEIDAGNVESVVASDQNEVHRVVNQMRDVNPRVGTITVYALPVRKAIRRIEADGKGCWIDAGNVESVVASDQIDILRQLKQADS